MTDGKSKTFMHGDGKEDRVADKPCATPTSGTKQRTPAGFKTAHNEYAALNCNNDVDMPASDDMNESNGMSVIMPKGTRTPGVTNVADGTTWHMLSLEIV